MFRWLFLYWLNPTDTPYITSKINLWSFVNIRLLKTKCSNLITYFVLGLNGLSLKNLKIFYKNNSFFLVYMKLFYLLLSTIVILFAYILLS